MLDLYKQKHLSDPCLDLNDYPKFVDWLLGLLEFNALSEFRFQTNQGSTLIWGSIQISNYCGYRTFVFNQI